jgi:ATP-dependent Lon protease
LDLIVSPCTTRCGHTFCKICLSRYLKEKPSCPLCRQPILQNANSLALNTQFESIIRLKYAKRYDEKRQLSSAFFDEEQKNGENKKLDNIPAIFLKDCLVWPKIKKRVIVRDIMYNMTVSLSTMNDRSLVIIPNENNQENIASLVEIGSISQNGDIMIIQVEGLKRFKVESFRNMSEISTEPIFICSGEIVQDSEISSDDLKSTIKEKLNEISRLNSEILSYCSYHVISTIEKVHGKQPIINQSNTITESISNLESISFYYLNLIKNDKKQDLYTTTNLIERVDW